MAKKTGRRAQPTARPALPQETVPRQSREPLLSLTTLVDRRTIDIDGAPYELKSPGEVSIFDRQRLRTRGLRLQRLMHASQNRELTEAEVVEVKDVLEVMTRLVLLAPEEVQQRLNDDHRLAIAQAFTTSLSAPAAPAESASVVEQQEEEPQKEMTTRTGEN